MLMLKVSESTCLKTRIVVKLSDLLRQETSPKTLALSIAIGMGLGVVPLLGMATALCNIAAIFFRLNLRAVQVANFVVLPLQIALVVPFVRLGEKMLRASSFPLYSSQLLAVLHHNLFRTLRALASAGEHALVAWMVAAPVAIALIYFSLQSYLISVANKLQPLPEEARAAAASG